MQQIWGAYLVINSFFLPQVHYGQLSWIWKSTLQCSRIKSSIYWQKITLMSILPASPAYTPTCRVRGVTVISMISILFFTCLLDVGNLSCSGNSNIIRDHFGWMSKQTWLHWVLLLYNCMENGYGWWVGLKMDYFH